MLTQDELNALKAKMPDKYVPKVMEAYADLTGKSISRRTVYNFFSGETYTIALHNATLYVAEKNRQTVTTLKKRTSDIINN
ncbi:MAG TPA: hypothetical protein VNQ80_12425 [Parapedobacter sp.]|uniref:hypothetical protein n=1 Tax=Parapedobacter sp. TaxID=1958893 RepID=UPI002C607402|nr:hypothetical protein [Parapedobacter sp.]HWK58143.1 hypothetical protein [Parapedobacter sp.]